jgi:hypothetical protein
VEAETTVPAVHSAGPVTQRRITFPLQLAGIRLRRRGGPALLAALGVAAAAAFLAAAEAGSLTARDAALRRGTAQIPADQRALRATWLGIPSGGAERWQVLDRDARESLAPLAANGATALVYREVRVAGALADLAAVGDPGRFIRIRTGRLPRACTPARCEVVQLEGAGPLPNAPGFHVVRVGTGRLSSELPFGALLTRSAQTPFVAAALAYHHPAEPPVLVAGDVAGMASIPALSSIYRSYSWAAPVAPASVHPWSVGTLGGRVERARSALAGRGEFDLEAPTDQLAALDATSRVAGRRLLLLGGEGAALLLAFLLLAAGGLRRDVDGVWRRLTWLGARRWQLALLTGVELGLVAAVGAAVGWIAGTAIGAAVAQAAGSPGGAVVSHSVLAGRGIATAAGIAIVSGALLVAAVRFPSLRISGRTLGVLDVAALGAAGAVLLALTRGSLGPDELATRGGTAGLVLLLPLLVAFVAAVAAARALGPALRLVERCSRRGLVSLRLASLSLARQSGRAGAVVVFLVVSVGLGLFAETYGSTLRTGQRDQAAFAVPLDFTVSEDLSTLVTPFQAAPLARYRALAPGVTALPVLRTIGDVSRLDGSTGVTLLGVPAGALTALHGWRSDFSHTSISELARRIEPRRPVGLRGPVLPTQASELSLPAELHGDPLRLSATVLTPGGDFVPLKLGTLLAGRRTLRTAVPAAARGGRLVSLTLGLVSRGNQDAAAQIARGTLRLGAPLAGGRVLPIDYTHWLGSGGVRSAGATVHYLVSNEEIARFRPRVATDGTPPAVIVSSRLAAAVGPDGLLPVDVGDQRLFVRPVGIADSFPTVSGDLLLADEGVLSTALDAPEPGLGRPSEVWIGAPTGERAAVADRLRRPPSDVLAIASRGGLERALRANPLARGALIALEATALVALALALLGVVLAVVTDLRDERGELLDLEAQGMEPTGLRRHVRLRALALLLAGLAGGVVTAALLSRLVESLVAVTASGEVPVPALVLHANWLLLVASVAAVAAAAALLVLGVTRLAFRERSARPGEEPA